ALDARREASKAEFAAWAKTAAPSGQPQVDPAGLHLSAGFGEGQGASATVRLGEKDQVVKLTDKAKWVDGPHGGRAVETQGAACELPAAGDFEKDQPRTCAAWVKVPASESFGAIAARMDNDKNFRGWDFWMQRRQVGTHVIDAWPGNALKVVGAEQIPANQWVHDAVTYDGGAKASGVKIYYDGKPQATAVEADALTGSIRTSVPLKIGQRHNNQPFTGAIADLRIYQRVLSEIEIDALAGGSRFEQILATPVDKRSDAQTQELHTYWLQTQDKPYGQLQAELARLELELAKIPGPATTIAHVMQEKNSPAMAFVLYRGEYDKRRDQVSPDTPDVLPAFPEDYPRNRLGFARWLLLPDQPLTARVTVNRFWQEVFGTGIVKTAGDFGVMGQLPSHPELLDWLAVDFRESGWDVKRLFKQIVMSNTYRQSAVSTPEKIDKDPANRLLARGPRFRMDAEMVRDHALAASGLLVGRIGGPSVKPYQPPGVWEAIAMNVSNTRSYQRGAGDDLYRRSMYTFIKRMAPPASMDIFNAPNRETCTVQRERTDTPLQALVTLNDEQFVEAARHLAELALKTGGDSFDGRLQVISRRLLARDFRPAEKEIIQRSLDQLAKHYTENPDDAKKLIAVGESKADASLDGPTLAAWTMLCNQLMNLDEALNK
ncbi:MAG: DUF1553 domain-containing protein, partial [Planctomycetales bacterium]|nr:DUF1553 domain-containing protein [Planctomycetales bacterium]